MGGGGEGDGGHGHPGTPSLRPCEQLQYSTVHTQALFLKEYCCCNCGMNILIFFRFYAEYTLVNILKLRLHQRNLSGFVMNPERFSTGLVLPFTHKWTNPK